MKIKFNKDFLWGGAGASEQMAGHGNTPKGKTVWDQLYQDEPKLFYNNIGPEITNDFTNRYKEDIAMWKEMGINSVRLGISWARLFPDGKTLAKESVDYYHDLLDELNNANIKPIMTLFHFDMPLWAQTLGGWESSEVIEKFVTFTDYVFGEYGDKVYMYATMNEPIVPVFAGYLGGAHYPRVNDPKRAAQAGFGTVLAHAKSVKLYREKYSHLKAQIGVVINISPAYAKDGVNFTDADKKAADDFNILHNFSMLDPMLKGEFPKRLIEILSEENIMPTYTQEDLKFFDGWKLDFVGMNYYSPTRVQAPNSEAKNIVEKFASHYTWDKARINVFRGWEIYPQAIYDASIILKERYDNLPFYISENGMGVQNEDLYRDKATGEIQDDYRIAFLQEHIQQIDLANKDGASCFGYHMWAITDNWSWANAYKNRYGFVEVNLDDQSRKFKKSAHWFAQVIKDNGFDDNFKKVDEVIDLKNVKYEESLNGVVEKED